MLAVILVLFQNADDLVFGEQLGGFSGGERSIEDEQSHILRQPSQTGHRSGARHNYPLSSPRSGGYVCGTASLEAQSRASAAGRPRVRRRCRLFPRF